MTITIKKAGEAAASKVIKTATAKQAVKASAAAATTPVEPPRAVSAGEAPRMMPAKESTKTTMMPWRGWFSRFLQQNLGDERFKSLKDTFYFMPDDPSNLQQQPMPATKFPVGNDGETAEYRYPSPGSQPPVRVPLIGLEEDPYDNAYFKKDTRRRYVDPEFPHPDVEKLKLDMMDPNDPEVQEAKAELEAGPKSSPGNKGRFATGPSDFDPSGLRAVMSITNSAMQAELDKHMPTHLPEPSYWGKEQELVDWYKEKGLPVPVGATFNFVRKERRVARW